MQATGRNDRNAGGALEGKGYPPPAKIKLNHSDGEPRSPWGLARRAVLLRAADAAQGDDPCAWQGQAVILRILRLGRAPPEGSERHGIADRQRHGLGRAEGQQDDEQARRMDLEFLLVAHAGEGWQRHDHSSAQVMDANSGLRVAREAPGAGPR